MPTMKEISKIDDPGLWSEAIRQKSKEESLEVPVQGGLCSLVFDPASDDRIMFHTRSKYPTRYSSEPDKDGLYTGNVGSIRLQDVLKLHACLEKFIKEIEELYK